jgi:hypothetical protein
MQLQMAVVNGFAGFCIREKTSPKQVQIINFAFDPDAFPLPTVSFRCVKKLESSGSLSNPGHRKHDRDKVYGMGNDKFQTDFTRDWNQMLGTCVEDNDQLLDILCDMAIAIKQYCDHKKFKFETVTMDPTHPPIMIPGENSMKICLQISGKVMTPDPKALAEAVHGV